MTTLETDREKLRRAAALAFRHTAEGTMPLILKLKDEQENARQLAARFGGLAEILTLLDEHAAAQHATAAREHCRLVMAAAGQARAILTEGYLP